MNPENESTDGKFDLADNPGGAPAADESSLLKAGDPDEEADSLCEEHRKPLLEYPVVGIGASAGGLQAFQELLRSLDSHTGMAFALITHLAPDQKSYLTEILAQSTKMPVFPIEPGVRPEPNHLYVLLPNQLASLDGGVFQVAARPPGSRSQMPIDLFFRSLAAEQKNFAIGVVLSGADADGAFGLKAIKGEGGLALVQAPETATHGSMPRSSIAADHVDLVKSPAELGVELSRLAQQFKKPDVRALELGNALDGDEQHFQRILQMLRGLSGLEFQQYKPATLRRRIGRRMMLMRLENLSDYARFLQVRPDELRLLQEDALINVTRFFRDAELWEFLSSEILPSFFRDHLNDMPVRIWCAGCSSGEEAYSLAILFLEHAARTGIDATIQLFGTDASERSIELARNGVYPEGLQHEISEERLRRYFVKVDRGYQVSKRVRDLCIFAKQNLASDPPFSHMDFVSCRNVLIYLNAVLQKQVLNTFHYALDPAGYLVLGSSESLRDYGEMFATVDRRHKIYTKLGIRIPSGYNLPPYFLSSASSFPPKILDGSVSSEMWPEVDLQRAADRIVLARYGPPGLIVDDQMNVLQSRGDTTPFIDLPSGPVSWNLSRVLRRSIAFPVKSAVERSIAENLPVSLGSITIHRDQTKDSVRVEVLPIASVSVKTRCFLILFENANQGSNRISDLAIPSALSIDGKDQLIAQLRQDLEANRFHLQSLVEERDSRNQELISANEEIQSANEELQSTNEELETTKEELQSANEELQTVNEELQQRNSVLMQTGNDLNNLLNSVNIPLLMLNNDFQIRQFTPPMQRLLSVRSTDIGRSISEIRLHLSIGDLEPMLREVLETLGTREQEVQDRDGRWYLLRVRPYRTSDNKIEGLVVLLMDIDQIRRSQQELRDARDLANSMLESVPIPVAVLNQDCTVRTANSALRDLSQLREAQLVGRSFPDLLQYLWGFDTLHQQLDDLRKGEPGTKLAMEHISTTQRRQTLLLKGEALLSDGDRAMLFTLEDLTLQRQEKQILTSEKSQLENEIKVAARRLERTQEELRGLTAHLFTVQEEERRHVARELHDDISQNLSILDLRLKALRDKQEQGFDGSEIDELRVQISELANDVRRISHRLHPAILDDLGLPAALKALVEEFGEREGMPATYSGINIPEVIPTNTAAALYRIAQEALRNVAKHAGKTHVKVILEMQDDVLILQVIDLGVGFDQDADVVGEGLGLISMTERARQIHGKLFIKSSLGKGTTMTVEAPLSQYE
jgi:two-component system, chemotaxis family, CheB/CheR fusion protein